MLTFDHIVVACSNLPEGVAHVEAALGERVGGGGKHDFMATHNHVLRLGDGLYLEIIAIDPDALRPSRPRWFSLDDTALQQSLQQGPRIVHWVVRTQNIEETLKAMDYDPGPVVAASRGKLHWKITIPHDGAPALDGALPTIIEWPPGPHVSTNMPDQGCSLQDFTIMHPRAARITTILKDRFIDDRVKVEAAEKPSFTASIVTSHGVRQLT